MPVVLEKEKGGRKRGGGGAVLLALSTSSGTEERLLSIFQHSRLRVSRVGGGRRERGGEKKG